MKATTKTVLGAAFALALGAGALHAHPGWGPGAAGNWGPGYGMGHVMGAGLGFGPMAGPGFAGRGYANPTAAVEARLETMKTRLGITSSQEPARKAFADTARQQAADMGKWRDTMFQASASGTAERIKLRGDWMKQRAEQRDRAGTAYQTLYQALSAEQRALIERPWAGYRGGRTK